MTDTIVAIDWETVTAQDMYDAAHASGVRFVSGYWLLSERAGGARCACAVGQLALLYGYDPHTTGAMSRGLPEDNILIEATEDLYAFLMDHGVPEDFLDGMSAGYETHMLVPDDSSLTARGWRIGSALRTLVQAELLDTDHVFDTGAIA